MDDVFKVIRRAMDPSCLTDIEQTHVPVIELPDGVRVGEMFQVTVKVGILPHAMEPGHHIQWVDLYADQTLLSRVTFTPTVPKPKTIHFLVLNESTTLRAVAFCNLDGFWESTQWMRVD